ncbi:MAG: T9SS type A sorting domain-containing protein [Crocinitomicaceae bacterium]|nr:T9SS type A sorting domain-containing protein [Crocinitomicaceae bacterium]
MSSRFVTLIILLFTLLNPVAAQNRKCSHIGHALKSGTTDYYSFENLRSDTIDILKYTIDLDMTKISSQQISAACQIDFRSKLNNVSELHLDLLSLVVDSVTSNDGLLDFEYNSPDLFIALPSMLNTDDSYSLTVHYHGHPTADASWGGFYFSSQYAFNLGVAFTDYPHNFGRAWFPCFDNFVERSVFDVNVLTSAGRSAYCGGIRTSVETVGTDSLLTHWSLEKEIPSYLVSVAVSNYTHTESSFTSASGDEIPIWLTAKPSDTTAFKQSFINLIPCLEGFEHHYGPYRWPRVGYVAVPFNGGAMEHATNIAYPLFAINGNLSEEVLFAHELSHHWWGDLVTCRTAEDMWLNEGWASYSEALFKEVLYGDDAYRNYIKENHKYVLLNAHKDDGGYYAVSGVPHEITYGTTVYRKGADIIHSLRGYMGDNDFFTGVQNFLEEHQYSDISSENLRDGLQQHTSQDMNSFFDNWVFSPGFPEFRIGSFSSSAQGNNYEVQVSIDQFMHHNEELFTNVPVTITILDDEYHTFEQTVNVSGSTTTSTIISPIAPSRILLNRDQRLNYAVLAEEKMIHSTGTNNLSYAEMDMSVSSLGGADSIWIRVENHWAAANGQSFIPFTDYFISPDRWWLVESNMPENAMITGKIRYYGNNTQNNYFDPQFFAYLENNGLNEEDIILLYRPDGAHSWIEWGNFVLNNSGSLTNWSGRLDINGMRPGQYAWAIHTGTIGISEKANENSFSLARKSENQLQIITGEKGTLRIFDTNGKLLQSSFVKDSTMIDIHLLSAGKYILKLNDHSVSFIK